MTAAVVIRQVNRNCINQSWVRALPSAHCAFSFKCFLFLSFLFESRRESNVNVPCNFLLPHYFFVYIWVASLFGFYTYRARAKVACCLSFCAGATAAAACFCLNYRHIIVEHCAALLLLLLSVCMLHYTSTACRLPLSCRCCCLLFFFSVCVLFPCLYSSLYVVVCPLCVFFLFYTYRVRAKMNIFFCEYFALGIACCLSFCAGTAAAAACFC